MLKLLSDGKLHSNSPWVRASRLNESESVGGHLRGFYTQADCLSQLHSSSFPLNGQGKAMSHCDLNNSPSDWISGHSLVEQHLS